MIEIGNTNVLAIPVADYGFEKEGTRRGVFSPKPPLVSIKNVDLMEYYRAASASSTSHCARTDTKRGCGKDTVKTTRF